MNKKLPYVDNDNFKELCLKMEDMTTSIFGSEDYSDLPKSKQYELLGMCAYILHCAITMDDLDTRELRNKLLMIVEDFASQSNSEVLLNLEDLARSEITSERIFLSSEEAIRGLFEKYGELFLDGGKIIKKKSDRHNIPDAWVLKNGKEIPVEMKKKDFDQKALEQLQRYMRTYNSDAGIAVAKHLTVELPDSITFMPVYLLKMQEYAEKHPGHEIEYDGHKYVCVD